MTKEELEVYIFEIEYMLNQNPIPIQAIKEKTRIMQDKLNEYFEEVKDREDENIQRGMENDLLN